MNAVERREFKDYGRLRLLDIEAEAAADWETGRATHVRVSLPASRANQAAMAEKGFIFGDRLLAAEIKPGRGRLDYARLARLPLEEAGDDRAEILEIALGAFPFDRRFQVAPDYDDEIAAAVLKGWVAELGPETFICRVKGRAAGFMAMGEMDDGRIAALRLAAVREEFRSSGAAVALYAGAVARAAANGRETVIGRFSAANAPVMNLYAFLGGVFTDPRDVYLKEIKPG